MAVVLVSFRHPCHARDFDACRDAFPTTRFHAFGMVQGCARTFLRPNVEMMMRDAVWPPISVNHVHADLLPGTLVAYFWIFDFSHAHGSRPDLTGLVTPGATLALGKIVRGSRTCISGISGFFSSRRHLGNKRRGWCCVAQGDRQPDVFPASVSHMCSVGCCAALWCGVPGKGKGLQAWRI